jgi:tRNA-Thr(GGU) m(6)t(6)A37 methyltransferase TsaA
MNSPTNEGSSVLGSRITYTPIGIIRSTHTNPDKTPIQGVYASGCRGLAEILPEYAEGLRDIEGFSHIYLIYDFHREKSTKLIVKPFLQDVDRGVFATRAPCRPNRIGLSIVELLSRKENVLYLDCVDILDGTPLLDIKPYAGRFDRINCTRNGWHERVDDETAGKKGKRGYGK